MPSEGPYSRVYHCLLDDERFVTVVSDDAAGWTWVKLLIVAEQAWPLAAFLPRWVKRRPLAVLVSAGIVELVGDRFRVHGLDPERQKRQDHASHAAAMRWHNPGNAARNAPSNAQPMPSTSTSTSTRGGTPAPAREGAPDDDALLWLSAHRAGIPEGAGLHLKLIGLVERHGTPKVVATWEAMPAGTGRQYVLGAENLLDTIARPNGRADAEAERETERKAVFQRQVDATQARIAELRGSEPPSPTPHARDIGAER